MPAGQQLQELGMKLRCDDSGSEHVSHYLNSKSLFCMMHIFCVSYDVQQLSLSFHVLMS